MYNLNVSMSAPPLLGVGPSTVSCTTPRTPEILNSVIAMTNPIEIYQQNHHTSSSLLHNNTSQAISAGQQGQQQQQFENQLPQIMTTEPSAGSNSDSSAAATPTENEGRTPSVRKTCSLFIKYGLKLSIESKRKQSAGDSSDTETSKSNRKDTINSMDTSDDDDDDDCDDDDDQKSPKNGLTPEDEERRRRRRERNKIAATKCRMKKRERTQNLVQESEILEKQNIDLKDLERKLEKERRELLEALQQHSKMCVVPGGYQAPTLTPTRHGSGCCSSTAAIKSEPVTSGSSSGRGRRGGGGRGRTAGRGGGGRGGGRKAASALAAAAVAAQQQVKQEPIHSPVQPDKSVLPNIMSSIQLPHFPAAAQQQQVTNNSASLVDSFYQKYSAMDESPSVDYYNYDATLTSVADAGTMNNNNNNNNNCANYLLKSPTPSVDSLTTAAALNELSNSSNFSYPMATPVQMNNNNGSPNCGSGGGNGMQMRPSPLIKNDICIPNCENSNDLLQCSPNMFVNHNMQTADLYMDQDPDTKYNEMTGVNGTGNNLAYCDDTPFFGVFC